MKKGFLGVIIVLVILGILGVGTFSWYISVGNDLVEASENVDFLSSQVEVQMQSRYELIPNLVSTVKGYAKHEEDVYTQIAQARSELGTKIQAGDINEANEAYNKLESSLSRLLMITENYPELKADKQFTALMDELASSQNKIDIARRNYNKGVKDFNVKIQKFPTSIVANKKGYTKLETLKAPEEAQKAPVINFD